VKGGRRPNGLAIPGFHVWLAGQLLLRLDAEALLEQGADRVERPQDLLVVRIGG
jgi:hypothetical protein